jgi:AcrR family transcriptional regulator
MPGMTSFKRARSEEQRAERRRVILDTAAAMLAEMPVAQVSLNELSRRVGLAKSNVLKYFESREAVLLELLSAATEECRAAFAEELAAVADPGAAPADRGDALIAAFAAALAARPVLCDLLSAQAAVLEHNVSAELALEYKRAAVANFTALTGLVHRYLPELGEDDAGRFTASALVLAGALWTHSHPAPAVVAAYEADPALALLRIDFTTSLRDVLEVQMAGLLARPSS